MTKSTGTGRSDETAAMHAAVRAWFDHHGWQLQPGELRHALQERGAGDDLIVELIDDGADRRRAAAAATPAQPAANGQLPPQNLEAEESVLGAMLISPNAIAAVVRTGLEPGDFYRDTHAKIYRAVCRMHAAGDPVDAITLADHLTEHGDLDQVGGRVRIHELAALVPATANVGHYARIVHDNAVLRGFIRTGGELARFGWERPGELTDLVDQARVVFAELEQAVSVGREHIRIIPATDFIATKTETVGVLLGDATDKVLPAGGFALVYGKGAAGKTTLTLTCVAALASATPWLGITVPRPVRVLMIENEGPKAPFIEKLERFHDQWDGPDFLPNVCFYEEPWGRFDLADRGMRDDLLAFTRDQHIDLVVAGPLRGLGMNGPGAPSETDAFLNLLKDAALGTELAWWIVHHTNKAGQISGDWDRQPDLLIRYAYEGKRRNRLVWEKIRWGDQGREPLLLEWLDEGVGYRIIDTTPDEIDWQELEQRVLTTIADKPGCSQRDVERGSGAKGERAREVISRLLDEGRIRDAGSGKPRAPKQLHVIHPDEQPPAEQEEFGF